MHKTVGELRNTLTNTELAHWMVMFKLYPMGEEAMDLRFGALTARLEAGIPTVQVKRGKQATIRSIFTREFWVKPLPSPKQLSAKIMGVFQNIGMEVKDDEH